MVCVHVHGYSAWCRASLCVSATQVCCVVCWLHCVCADSADGFPHTPEGWFEAGLSSGKGKVGGLLNVCVGAWCRSLRFCWGILVCLYTANQRLGGMLVCSTLCTTASRVCACSRCVHDVIVCVCVTYCAVSCRALTRPSTGPTSTSSGGQSATCTWRTRWGSSMMMIMRAPTLTLTD